MSSSSSSDSAPQPVSSPEDDPPFFGREDPGAKATVQKLFPEIAEALAKAGGRGKALDWRKVLEPIEAVEQCEKALKDTTQSPNCYLCGQIIYQKSEFGKNYAHALYPECEHILPVTTARWYLTLYMGKNALYAAEELEMEYAWAHRVCNQTKSNELYVTENRDTRKLEINEAKLVESLQDIGAAAKTYLAGSKSIASLTHRETLEAIAKLKTTKNAAKERSGAVISEKLTRIVNYVNGQPAGPMTTLARVTFMMDTSVMTKDIQTVAEEYFKANPDEVSEVTKNLKEVVAYSKGEEPKKDVAPNLAKELVKSLKDMVIQRKSGNAGSDLLDFLKLIVKGFTPTAEIRNVFRSLDLSTLDAGVSAKIEPMISGTLPVEYMFKLQRYYTMNLYTLVLNELGKVNLLEKLPRNLVCMLNSEIEIAVSHTKELAWEPIVTMDPTIAKQIADMCTGWQPSEKKILSEGVSVGAQTNVVQQFTSEEVEAVLNRIGKLVDLRNEILQIVKDNKNDTNPTVGSITAYYTALKSKSDERLYLAQTLLQELRNFTYGPQTPETLQSKDYLIATRNHIETATIPIMKEDIAFYTSALKDLEGTVKDAETLRFLKTHKLEITDEPDLPKKGGRKTRRAKLSQHTKRARRSGLSTKWRKRSFRKSRMGKLTKRSRY